ncbi:restriction endonuclease subunit S [Alphaproteobacteria bacterium]|nr:restriction endonuclease subunit S [Alphaproteobacteria bacterium]
MPSKLKPLGKLIRLTDEKNRDGNILRLLGINISKNFMPSVANISGVDLSKYKVIRKKHFACNIMHVGRDERLPISLYQEEQPAIVSPAYKTFEVANPNEILPEYLMIFFHRGEFDRLTWYLCDSSIRGGLEWDRFCEIEVPVPSIEEQKRYVDLYDGLMQNQKCYKDSLDDLRLICDTFIEDQIKKGKAQKLGPLIRQTEEKNKNSSNRNLLGISVNKVFIQSRANRDDLIVSNCKIIEKRQFAYVTVTSRNGGKISIALLNEPEGIISSTYIAFEVIDTSILLPEYLYLWFSRPEFDRYARFHSWGSARETFDWTDMLDVTLPIPSIDEQKSIVAIHHTLETRKQINEKFKETIRPLCAVLMQGVIKDLKIKEVKAA